MFGSTLSTIDVTVSSNGTRPDDSFQGSNQNQVLTVLLCIIGSFGFLGNVLVVVVIFQYTKMRRVLTNMYVINQSILDASAGLMLLLTTLFEDDGVPDLYGIADDVYCRIWLSKVPLWAMLFSSTYNLVALTLERYLAIVHPIKHRMSVTTTKVAASIVVVWMVGFSIQLPLKIVTGYIEEGRCNQLRRWPNPLVQRAMGVFMVFVQFILPITIIAICYCRMYLVLRVNTVYPSEVQANGGAKEPKHSETSVRASKNIFKTLLIVSACFIICWIWNQGYFLLFNLGVMGPMFTSAFYYFSIGAVSLNCCINPVIYVVHYEQFKRGLQHLRRKLCGRILQDVTLVHPVTKGGSTIRTRGSTST